MRPSFGSAGALLAAAAVAVAPAATADAAARPAAVNVSTIAYSTGAYATHITGALAGSGIKSGSTVPTGIGCTTTPGLSRHNSVASSNLQVVKTGAVHSTSETIGSATSRRARSTNTVAGLNVLGGLITATAVTTATTSTLTSAGHATGTNRSTLTGLKIGGVAISADTKPNTRVSPKLNGKTIGSVVVNEQSKKTTDGTVTGTTRALDVKLTSAALGLKAGARIIVGNTRAALNGTPAGFAGGNAYSLKSTLADGAVHSGPLANASVACTGGTHSASTASGSVPSVLSIGATKTTTESSADPTVTSTATNTIASASVLSGLISVTNIKASTTTTRASKIATPISTDHSTFGTLKVAGVPIVTPSVAPNTTITLPGLGKVTFHKVTRSKTGIKVVMINIVLSKALGTLPTGSTIEVGVSETSAH